MCGAGDMKKKRPKSFRLIHFRKKSAEGVNRFHFHDNYFNRHFRLSKRSSVDSAMPENHRIKSPPLSERVERIEKDNKEPIKSKPDVVVSPDPVKIQTI